ncbi:MAG: 30S ribosomal protein S4 [Oscillospiraceae bacterium]|jgi:small subunit ribosomal protein S4|nr:30S ribosomal protein S4 [Oscillospiraceae bacterium]MBQ4256732.1 30S ribosomal protein S4 [Oscillospiraceae bacterium]MBQ9209281.1 30S ribosomal protein S4 [Oscillospiraceae bacterium]MBR4346608.1 30S ribosomal protein S4 [Oscillospiraceae bacterium]
MAISREPILRRCRYLGISPMVMGVSKESNRNPGNGARRKVSEYGTQLKEKQKFKFIYGVLEKPFRHYFELANKMEGKAGDNLVTICESRLDNVVYRMGYALTRREARQLVSHRHFTVNGKRVNIPSYRVKVGDVIALHEGSRDSVKFKDVLEQTNGRMIPLWLESDKENFCAKVVRMPETGDLDFETQTHLIVELYSK